LIPILTEIAEIYNLKQLTNSEIDVKDIYALKMRTIFNDTGFVVVSANEQRLKVFCTLVEHLGGHLDSEDPKFILLDPVFPLSRSEALKNYSKSIPVISIYWLVECFFCMQKVPEGEFKI
jgi:hypothetical protein